MTDQRTISRILFHAVGGSGLGHLSRQIALARAIREVRPATELAFASESAYGPTLGPEFPFFVLPSIRQLRSVAWSPVRWTSGPASHVGNGRSEPAPATVEMGSPAPTLIAMTEALLTSYRPGLIIHDTLVWPPLFEIAEDMGLSQALVLRARRDLAEAVSDPAAPLMRADLLILPHAAAEAAEILAALPDHSPPAVSIGATVRGRTMSRHGVCNKLGVPSDAKLIVVTAGGGGTPEVPAFYRLALDGLASASLAAGARVVLVLGPEYQSAPPTSRYLDLQVWQAIAWMPDLIAAADLVICQAGYNTMGEVQAAGTPAVVVPGERGIDDQDARAREAMRNGPHVRVLPEADSAVLGKLIDEVIAAPTGGAPAATNDPVAAAERAAALERIADLGHSRRRRDWRGEALVLHCHL
jgi:predicted glycosyltransferase